MTYEAASIPWSGWWWPYSTGGLATGAGYQGHPAPLEKYDWLVSGGYPGASTRWELATHYDPTAPGWYGHCDDWARAAVSEDLIEAPVSIDNIVFYVGDKKGLLAEAHTGDTMAMANGEDPAAFHSWLWDYVADQALAFVADLDPSIEVWSYPIYRFSQTEWAVGAGWRAFETTIWYADDFVSPDYVGTHERSATYTYELRLDQTGRPLEGRWTGASTARHPGLLSIPTTAGSRNPYVSLERVREIALTADDFLETIEGAEALSPGSYNLVLLDEDDFFFDSRAGDELALSVSNPAGPAQLWVCVYDILGGVVASGTVGSGDRWAHTWTAAGGLYRVSVIGSSYDAGTVYALDYDDRQASSTLIPNLAGNTSWTGMAVTNSGGETARRFRVVALDSGGKALKTVHGPEDVPRGGKRVFTFEDLDIWRHLIDDVATLRFSADAPLEIVCLQGRYGQTLSLVPLAGPSDRLVLPDTGVLFGSGREVRWGLMNPGRIEVLATLRLYSEGGQHLDEAEVSVPPGGHASYTVGYPPFHAETDGGWIEVVAMGGAQLSAYVRVTSDQGRLEEMIPGLGNAATQLFVPNVPGPPAWTSLLCIINPDDASNTVRVRDNQGAVVTEVELGPGEKTALDMTDIARGRRDLALVLDAEDPVCGYFEYRTREGRSAYPLLSTRDLSGRLVLPHPVSTSRWWTGVVLFNGGTDRLTARMTPYDLLGNPMQGLAMEVGLDVFEKWVASFGDVFGATDDISYLDVTVVEGPSSGLGGIWLYGDPKSAMLAGGIMK